MEKKGAPFRSLVPSGITFTSRSSVLCSEAIGLVLHKYLSQQTWTLCYP